MDLNQFAAEVNRLSQEEVEQINATKPLFAAAHVPLPPSMLAIYHKEGLTPKQTLDAIKDQAEL